MATTYTVPASGPDAYNIHEHGHARTQKRRSLTQRAPLQPTAMNGQIRSAESAETVETQHKRSSRRAQDDSHDCPDFQDSNINSNHSPHHHSYSTSQLLSPAPPSANLPHDRSQSMDRRKPVLPTHLDLRDRDYGFPAVCGERHGTAAAQGARKPRRWITGLEILSSLLITVPYILISLAIPPPSIRTPKIEDAAPDSAVSAPTGTEVEHYLSNSITTSKFLACIITSVTLLTIGAIGKFRGAPNVLDGKKATLGYNKDTQAQQTRFLTFGVARRIVSRLLCVGLPIYAATNIGGYRVALIMLVALAGELVKVEDRSRNMTRLEDWKQIIKCSKWTVISISLQMVCDVLGWTAYQDVRSTAIGYVSLGTSLLLLPPSFPSTHFRASYITAPSPRSAASTSAVVATPWEAPRPAIKAAINNTALCPLICTTQDTGLTIGAGVILAVLSIVLGFLSTDSVYASSSTLGLVLLIACSMVVSILLSRPESLQESKYLGITLGATLSFLVSIFNDHPSSRSNIAFEGFLILSSIVASAVDTHAFSSSSSDKRHDHDHHDHHRTKVQHDHDGKPSRMSKFLIRKFEHISLLHSILIEKDSRRIFYFMILNFLFMIVQAFYGFVTDSLGLLSDSIHMFFDCVALLVGLCAAVMTKWPPTEKHPYGYGKMDAIAGFANGLFLMYISIEIVLDAIKRLRTGRDIQRLGELLIVSFAGLLVNIIGLTAFGHAHHGHGHDHSHGGHDHAHETQHHAHSTHDIHAHPHHDHDHGPSNTDHQNHGIHDDPSYQHHNENVNPNRTHLHAHSPAHTSPLSATIPSTPSKPCYTQPHAHGKAHGHNHKNENMHGIWLHVFADALGSVAVVVSTILIHYSGWSGFDPLASCLIAIAIFASAVPLVKSTFKNLQLTMPEDIEFDIRETLSGISALNGVVGYAAPRFWLQSGDEPIILGVIHVIAAKGTDLEDVRARTCQYLGGRGMDITVQVERERTGRCWCGQGQIR